MSARDLAVDPPATEVVTVTPNPALDWTVEVPGFTPGAVNRVAAERTRPAGKGVNVAAALAAYGRRVAATGFLGRENETVFRAFFARRGIEDRFVRVEGATRVGVKITDPARRETTDVNFPGAAVTADDVRVLGEMVDVLAVVDRPWFVLAGSLPPGAAPTAYRDLAAALKARGCTVVVDTSGEPLRHALAAAPHVVKPNVHELEALVGRALETTEAVVDAARALLEEHGVELAVVSMGAEGALFVERGGVILARPPAVEVRSTVGAGDAMVAGIVAGRLAGLALPDVARLATAFSLHALTAEETGAGSRAEIGRLVERVTVHEMRPT